MASPSKADLSPSPRPSSPSPAKSFRNRMSTAMRRASTGLVFKNQSLSRQGSRSSLKVDPAQATTSPETHVVPSPVVENAAGETAETPDPVGPSPLANSTTAQAASEPIADQPLQRVLTASPDHLPVELPHTAPVAPPAPFGFTDPIVPVAEPESVPPTSPPEIAVAEPSPAPVAVSVPAETSAPTEPSHAPEPASEIDALRPALDSIEHKSLNDTRPDYFAWSDVPEPVTAPEPQPAEEATAPIVPSAPVGSVVEEPSHAQVERGHPSDPTDASTLAWADESALGHKRSTTSVSATQPAPMHVAEPSQATSHGASTRTSRSSLTSSYGQPTERIPAKHSKVSLSSEGSDHRRGRSSSVHFLEEDPFADPPTHVLPAPRFGLSPVESLPEPVVEPHAEVIHDSPTHVSFPLPPMRDVIAEHYAREMPVPVTSAGHGYSLGERDGASLAENRNHHEVEVDERIPLLQHVAMSRANNPPQTPPRPKTTHAVAIAFPTGPVTNDLAVSNSLHAVGWTEYVLPDSSCYYVHAGSKITTDIDLRHGKKLQVVMEYIDRRLPQETNMPPPLGWELWLKDVGVVKRDFVSVKSWVNHTKRLVSQEPPPMLTGDGFVIEHLSEDDRLDMEYRYWAFLEGHPAHTTLTPETHAEAMDALNWSYTDCLLPPARPVSPPFALQECQELMKMLQNSESSSKNGAIVRTRIVSRVLLRVVQWRQIYFRPTKPLPKDALKGAPQRRVSFARRVADLLISVICLGIPYIFMSRTQHRRLDEESGIYSSGPMLVVGACACLIAAVILSASVTFLSLPQLDEVARLAGFLAILFSASSMVSAVVALMRYKADMERTVFYVGGEGLMVLSRQSVIMSLPLVFLAWGIAAFMTGITFYSFRGASVSTRFQIRHPFEDYTHWAVVGTLGAVGGMLFVATLFTRR